ncbi:reverse transcriptase family protein [Burkholderia pseudomallei]|uniref:reverse transcriptase family protein n=1 Tax=Burkholderia pseudomallei TaxID=28450 RepID=UPI0015C3CAED|nr:reverse transcriptase family protein [Burkholderia pseudomallei]
MDDQLELRGLAIRPSSHHAERVKARNMKFSLHAYLKPLRENGASQEYIEALARSAKPLVDNGLPVLLTLGHLAHVCDVPYGMLVGIISRHTNPYRVFSIRKRSGGKRFICVPEPLLMQVQRWIHDQILCSPFALARLSRHATAYAPQNGPVPANQRRIADHVKNAERHLGATWIVKLDISNFFESISERQIYHVFREFGYRALVAFCLARLCTRVLPLTADKRLRSRAKRWHPGKEYKILATKVVGHLPQGAPTSPMLANLVCVELDRNLQSIAVREALTYSRYADDMTFSGEFHDRSDAVIVLRELSRVVAAQGFSINALKTNIAKNGGRKIVTGLSVDGDSIRVPRAYKDKIRQELYFIGKHGLTDHCNRIDQRNQLSYLLRLAGRIRYVSSVEAEAGNLMMKKLLSLFPTLLDTERILSEI